MPMVQPFGLALRAAALLAATVFSMGSSAVAAPPEAAGPGGIGPDGTAFYVPPSPLPDGEPGSVIWTRPLTGTMALPSAARNLLVLYRSRDPAGATVPVSGTVSLPKGTPPQGGWPVIVWTHGTTGIAAVCGPSRDTASGPEHAYIEDIRSLLDQAVAKGYAIVATDYQGLGVAGFHPFFQGVPNAQNALDMLRAGRAVAPEIGRSYGVMGHSQGGQADLFTAAIGPAYAPEFKLVGNVAMAPGSHIAARLDAVRGSDTVELALPYVLYVLGSYAHTDPSIDLSRILTPEAKAHLPDLQIGCMTAALTQGYWSKAIAKDQFLPAPDLTAFLAMGARNEPGALALSVPTLVMQGTADQTVRPKDTDGMVRALCASGNAVLYKAYSGQSHDGVMAAGAQDALGFLADRFAGKPAETNCTDLPRAGQP
ncbi:lipase family protein [Aquabacter spiritensis]|uniref:Secretory lipase n=1 Tax=Aquabacter spiritensis TaxID=933073 RepID=A0A4R3M454_9HYPH|nr:lipase family protein [Aquabacter spiritensis]TCT07822.1 secretory lipase [Aquabacter spiritensis]